MKCTIIDFFKKHKLEVIFLVCLFLITVFLRFTQLGYSHFYGDETKVFYLDKTVPAFQFFLDQRKGPVQFLVVWVAEKMVGGFDEFWTRIPFALAGTLSVFVFYLVVKRLFDFKVASIASFLFSINGFYIAFSRTIQYQSFLTLFGFLAFLFVLYYSEKKKPLFLLVSAVFLALAFLTHYDAFFFAIPVLYVVLREVRAGNVVRRNTLIYFLLPLFVLVGLFYMPYISRGYLQANTFGYISRRLSGSNFSQNYSPYTFFIYNPLILASLPLLVAFLTFFRRISWQKSMLILWFLVPFIVFQFVILNPGTHVHCYLIPILVLASCEIVALWDFFKFKILGYGVFVSFLFLFYLSAISMFAIYVPIFNTGTPWKVSRFGPFTFPQADKSKHLFLYGFPYNRGWDQVRDYLYAKEGVRNVYTNDNATLAEYYLEKFDVTPPGSNYLPQYFFYVYNNQEFRYPPLPFLLDYTPEEYFYVDGVPVSVLYRLIRPPQP